MEKTINSTCSPDVIKLLFIVVLVVFIIWLLYSLFTHNNPSESFKSIKSNNNVISNNPIVYDQKKISIIPSSCDDDTGIIQSGSKFIHQDHYFTPWGTVIAADGSSTNDSLNSDYTMSFKKCNSSCCSDQWPVPFKINDDLLCNSEDEFVPTSYYCNDGFQNSGCLCMTKKQSDFLNSRGLNTD